MGNNNAMARDETGHKANSWPARSSIFIKPTNDARAAMVG